jgi:hypothetical protein
MEKVFRNFYKQFYFQTGGFIPVQPIGQTVLPGDFFQIRNGNIIILGNIFRGGIVDRQNVLFHYGVALQSSGWRFSDEVKKAYSSRGIANGPVGSQFEYSKMILAFGRSGSFIFNANNPESVKIMNWNELQYQLIVKLTQTCYSFRELYVVTETATASDWTLAVGGAENAELEIATDLANFGLGDIFGHESAKTIQSKDIEFYHREHLRKPSFFKAKKLQVQDDKMETFISSLISERKTHHQWAGSFFESGFDDYTDATPEIAAGGQSVLLDMLQVNQLNPNTALEYFKWADANAEDVEKLFFSYG